MNRSTKMVEELTRLLEYDPEDIPDVTSDDTIIQNVTDPKFGCPTCGVQLDTGILNVERIQCPGCGHEVKDIGGTALSGLRPRRLDHDKAV